MKYTEALNYSTDTHLFHECLDLLCGKKLGEGMHRDVYEYAINPKQVIKIQRNMGEFNNIVEFEIWCKVQYGPHKDFFAPCHWLSANGRILIQSKTSPITSRRPAPERIPNFFTDVKESNFGWLGKNFVAHDYDYTLIRALCLGLTKRTQPWKPHNLECS